MRLTLEKTKEAIPDRFAVDFGKGSSDLRAGRGGIVSAEFGVEFRHETSGVDGKGIGGTGSSRRRPFADVTVPIVAVRVAPLPRVHVVRHCKAVSRIIMRKAKKSTD